MLLPGMLEVKLVGALPMKFANEPKDVEAVGDIADIVGLDPLVGESGLNRVRALGDIEVIPCLIAVVMPGIDALRVDAAEEGAEAADLYLANVGAGHKAEGRILARGLMRGAGGGSDGEGVGVAGVKEIRDVG